MSLPAPPAPPRPRLPRRWQRRPPRRPSACGSRRAPRAPAAFPLRTSSPVSATARPSSVPARRGTRPLAPLPRTPPDRGSPCDVDGDVSRCFRCLCAADGAVVFRTAIGRTNDQRLAQPDAQPLLGVEGSLVGEELAGTAAVDFRRREVRPATGGEHLSKRERGMVHLSSEIGPTEVDDGASLPEPIRASQRHIKKTQLRDSPMMRTFCSISFSILLAAAGPPALAAEPVATAPSTTIAARAAEAPADAAAAASLNSARGAPPAPTYATMVPSESLLLLPQSGLPQGSRPLCNQNALGLPNDGADARRQATAERSAPGY